MDKLTATAELANILNMTEAYTRGLNSEGYASVSREVLVHYVSEKAGKSRKKPEDTLEGLEKEVRTCACCALGETRTHAVPGEGSSQPQVMIIGEGPGRDEDACGRPFVGRAGQYLDKWLEAVSLDRQKDCYIANIVKCRPPGNRDPLPEEQKACTPYLYRQIQLLRPKVILTLGRIAFHYLTGETLSMSRGHGRLFSCEGVPLIPTYHPSGVLRNPEYRRPVWEDLQVLRRELERG